jgi:hypothetical protein
VIIDDHALFTSVCHCVDLQGFVVLWGVVYYVCVESLKSSLRREQQKDMVLNSAYLDPHAVPSSRRGTEPVGGGSSIQNHETFRPAFKKERSETSLAASHILGVSAPAQTTCARVDRL